MFSRCYEMAGITRSDRIHITPGYGLWTAGIGFQLGCELLGAMAIPMGPGNTDKQIRMMMDLQSTVICATSSYALLLAEEIEKRGVGDRIKLRKGVIGSERWGDKMRERISKELGVELYDIYGLTEVYGPGIGISCGADTPMHYWDDFIYLEIIDPKTGKALPDGEIGEIVITTLKKEGAPLIRYRTHDLSRIVPEECACGSRFPRIDRIIGRSDDMVKVKGVNIYPGQIEDVLRAIDGVSSEYQVMIDHLMGKDEMTLFFETEPTFEKSAVEEAVGAVAGKRIAFVGDGSGNMARSFLEAAPLFDFTLQLGSPSAFRPPPAEAQAAGRHLTVSDDPRTAVAGADVVVTDVWTSMGQEAEAAARLKAFQGFTVDGSLMAGARPGAIVLHCLPAHRGEEISEEVLEGPASRVFEEAENRMHLQKALLEHVILGGVAETTVA
jgi:phenylacetate-CoA ligase